MAKEIDISRIMQMLPGLETKEKGQVEPYPSQATKLRENEERYPGLVPFETKGRFKLLNKYSQMKVNYQGSKETAKSGYNSLPFGPRTKAAFTAAMDANPEKTFEDKLVVSHEKKWANNWMKGISK